jgi:hypothetical protein
MPSQRDRATVLHRHSEELRSPEKWMAISSLKVEVIS